MQVREVGFLFSKLCYQNIFIWLNILENIEMKLAFQSKAFFYLSNTVHTSCLISFKDQTLGSNPKIRDPKVEM